jgi:hypothetical protein
LSCGVNIEADALAFLQRLTAAAKASRRAQLTVATGLKASASQGRRKRR